MERRQFLIGTATAIGVPLLVSPQQSHGDTKPDVAERTYHVLGVPLRSGSLVPGNENDAQAYRAVQLVSRLQQAGCKAVDDGDVAIPSYLPHHSVPPIRSWPGPRIAWDCVSEHVALILKQAGQVPFMVGCDCSVVVGTTQSMMQSVGSDIHVLYVDGDFDDAPPRADQSQSAAACAAWLLTHQSPFWAGPALPRSQVSVIGWSRPSQSGHPEASSVPLAEIRRTGAAEAARRVLQRIPASSAILLHFDIDVLQKREMPVAYFPHDEGLTLAEARELFSVLLKDPRIRLIEVSEYAALRDLDQLYVKKLVDLLAEGLGR
jgi:arginase